MVLTALDGSFYESTEGNRINEWFRVKEEFKLFLCFFVAQYNFETNRTKNVEIAMFDDKKRMERFL